MLWARGRRTPFANSWSSPLRTPAWIGRSMWRSTRVTFGRQRWITCCADASKARRVLGWEPTVSFNELVHDHGGGRYEGLEAAAQRRHGSASSSVAAEGRHS